MKKGTPEKMLGSHLAGIARRFGANEVEHVGGGRYVARRPDGQELRMVADEGVGTVEGEDAFEQAWRPNTWHPTHLITRTGHEPVPVMLTEDGVAYTRAEWDSQTAADYEVQGDLAGGEWTFQGQPFDGTVEGIEKGIR